MKTNLSFTLLFASSLLLFAPPSARAHCDTLGGPVVLAAKEALDKGQITPVLKWVKADQEAEIRTAFAQTLQVRKQSPEAAKLADMYFFETLVRVHRQGEGAPYTGLKPDDAIDPALEAADQAIAAGGIEPLLADLTAHLNKALRARFAEVYERRTHMNDSVDAGREYTEAYVTFIHLYERLFNEAKTSVDAHGGHVH
ncbi:MAG: DUF6448 family protein [Opitutaceae bacterium]|nr:DUF6448 family protein [Opitutaceae bacterium]